jgi:tetratricopeptide (TPR) repeat protein
VRHHQAGQLFDAENVYRQVLASDSRHFGSLHHLGIIALQKGQAQAAVDVISRALASNNRVPDCHYNMAFALQTLGRLSEAVGYYRQAIELKPDYVEAHTNLGNVLKELGSHREAAACYERSSPQAKRRGALQSCQCAGQTRPIERSGRLLSARARAQAGPRRRAQQSCQCAGGARPSDEALIHFQRALELEPNLVEAHVNLGADPAAAGKDGAPRPSWSAR